MLWCRALSLSWDKFQPAEGEEEEEEEEEKEEESTCTVRRCSGVRVGNQIGGHPPWVEIITASP